MGFFQHHPRLLADQPVLGEVPADRAVEVGGGGEVVGPHLIGALVELGDQIVPAVVPDTVHGDVIAMGEEVAELVLGQVRDRHESPEGRRGRAPGRHRR